MFTTNAKPKRLGIPRDGNGSKIPHTRITPFYFVVFYLIVTNAKSLNNPGTLRGSIGKKYQYYNYPLT